MALEAAQVHDDKNFEVYMGRVGSLIAASDLRPEEKSAMLKKVQTQPVPGCQGSL